MRSNPGTGLVDRVYREILGSIVTGEFKEGDQLPTEQALTLRFAASRPTMRHATAPTSGTSSMRERIGKAIPEVPVIVQSPS